MNSRRTFLGLLIASALAALAGSIKPRSSFLSGGAIPAGKMTIESNYYSKEIILNVRKLANDYAEFLHKFEVAGQARVGEAKS